MTTSQEREVAERARLARAASVEVRDMIELEVGPAVGIVHGMFELDVQLAQPHGVTTGACQIMPRWCQ